MRYLLILLLALSSLSATYSQSSSNALQAFNISDKHLAIEGYDPVSYFTKNKPVKGKPAISVIQQGITYLFSSESNKNAFVASPQKYLPQYGGWCAYAMGSTGEKVEVDPETFKIVNGKLYLFYNAFFNNTLKSWNKDEPELLKNANANWPKFYH